MAGFNAASLRSGPYAAAQLWKLDSIRGRHFDLAGHIAPFLANPAAMVPPQWVNIFRILNRFAIPHLEPGDGVRFYVLPEEVRGTDIPVHAATFSSFPRRGVRALPRNATQRGFVEVSILSAWQQEFANAWEMRCSAGFPFATVDPHMGVAQLHPVFERLWARASAVETTIFNNRELQRARIVRYRQRLADRYAPVYGVDLSRRLARVDEARGLVDAVEEDSD